MHEDGRAVAEIAETAVSFNVRIILLAINVLVHRVIDTSLRLVTLRSEVEPSLLANRGHVRASRRLRPGVSKLAHHVTQGGSSSLTSITNFILKSL